MKIKIDKIMSYSSEELYQILLPLIDNFYKRYEFAYIKNDVFRKLALNAINDCKKRENLEKEDFGLVLLKHLSEHVNDYLKNSFENSREFISVISNFIKENMKLRKTCKSCLKEVLKLSDFLGEIDFLPTPDLLIEIIQKNSLLNELLRVIVEDNLNLIQNNEIDKIVEDEIFCSLIETYCMLKGIQIKEESEDDFYKSFDSKSNNIEYTSDGIKTYLREISMPLLSAAEEKEIAYRVLQGDQKARSILIERNLKLVVSIAKKYIGRGLSFMDLIGEGNIGLMTAVEKYDVTRGYRFSTYATHWIRQAINAAIASKGRNIRVPVYLYEKIGKYINAQAKLENKFLRKPTIEEIAKEMRISIKEATSLYTLQMDTVSINGLIGDDEDSELEDFIPSSIDNPIDEVISSTLQSQVTELMKKCNLKEREMQILLLRYGFNEEKPKSLEKIGKILNISRERVRQIEARAIMRIRRSRYIKDFAVYMENPDRAIENIEEFRSLYRDDLNISKKYDLSKSSPPKINSPVSTKGDLPIQQQESIKLHETQVIDAMKDELDAQSLEEDISKKVKEKKIMPKQVQTLYEYLGKYTREEIDTMLMKLTEEEKELLKLRYGDDLDHPVTSDKWSKELYDRFYGTLVPRMRRLLANPEGKKFKKTETSRNVEKTDITDIRDVKTTEEHVECEIEKKSEVPEEKIIVNSNNSSILGRTPQASILENKTDVIDKQDYIGIFEILKTANFGEMLKLLTPQEAVIICLRLGYVNGKYFSTEAISEFLNIEVEEVRETTKKVLLLYKESINQFIDQAISVVEDKPLKLKK